jgi:hypothetical protein
VSKVVKCYRGDFSRFGFKELKINSVLMTVNT